MVAHNPIMIHIKGVIARKITLVLMDLSNTHNIMSKVFALSLGHPIGTMDPSWKLLSNGQIHSTNLFHKRCASTISRIGDLHRFLGLAEKRLRCHFKHAVAQPRGHIGMCKRGLVYCIKPNGFIFELICM